VRRHHRVELLPGLSVDDGFLAAFARMTTNCSGSR
jgi:hypothetical protein